MQSIVSDRLGNIGDRLRERRTTAKVEHLGEENDRLRTELHSLQTQLDRERADRVEILDALKGKPKTVIKRKRGGLIRMVVIGGGAYVLGTRAGRERYEQLADWAKRFRDRGRDAADDLRDDMLAGSTGPTTSPTKSTSPPAPSKSTGGTKSGPTAGTSGS